MRRLLSKAPPELRTIAALAVAEGFARTLSFGFYIVAARTYSTENFGVVRYTIVLATLALAPATSAGSAIVRELGAARRSREETGELLAAVPYVGLVVWVVSVLLCVVAGALGATGSADVLGLVVVTTGLVVFRLYYGVGRGVGLLRRIVITYVVSSTLQLIVFGALVAFADPSPRTALIIFGVASAAPIVVLELFSPVVFSETLRLVRSAVRRIWALTWRLALNPLFNLAWLSADQIWVESQLGTAEVGRYGAAKSLVQVFMVLIAAGNGVLVPRVSELRAKGELAASRKLMRNAVIGLTSVALLVSLLLIALRDPLLGGFFGPGFESAGSSLIGLSVAMTVGVAFYALAGAMIGWGRPLATTAGIGTAAVVEVFLLIGVAESAVSAAWINAASMAVGLLVLVGVLVIRGLPGEPTPPGYEPPATPPPPPESL